MSALSVLRDRLKGGRKAFRGLGSPEAILKAFRLGSQRNGIYVAAHGASGAFPIKTPVFLFAPFFWALGSSLFPFSCDDNKSSIDSSKASKHPAPCEVWSRLDLHQIVLKSQALTAKDCVQRRA
jgi:hypothetical protein